MVPWQPALRHLATTVLAAVVVSGCLPPEPSPDPADSTTSEVPAGATSPADTATLDGSALTDLRLAPRPAYAEDYERDAFGSAWTDVDDNGCNQRDDVLLRDALTASVQPQGTCDHDVVAGSWRDPYTGVRLTFGDLKDPRQAQAIQIDHVVPLAEAWVSGAREWPDRRRLRFANDLDNLLAVDGPTNQAKGADDPAAWRPRQDHQCAYAQRWIRVKQTWDLAVDRGERDALAQLLSFC